MKDFQFFLPCFLSLCSQCSYVCFSFFMSCLLLSGSSSPPHEDLHLTLHVSQLKPASVSPLQPVLSLCLKITTHQPKSQLCQPDDNLQASMPSLPDMIPRISHTTTPSHPPSSPCFTHCLWTSFPTIIPRYDKILPLRLLPPNPPVVCVSCTSTPVVVTTTWTEYSTYINK